MIEQLLVSGRQMKSPEVVPPRPALVVSSIQYRCLTAPVGVVPALRACDGVNELTKRIDERNFSIEDHHRRFRQNWSDHRSTGFWQIPRD